MHPAKTIDSRTHDEIERRLIRRLEKLNQKLRLHEEETSKRLPSDDEEAASIKSEMDIVETHEKAESGKIRAVQKALDRLKKGSYGICEACRQPIAKGRLKAAPECRFCLACQKGFEDKAAEEEWPY